jgi:hypothetical protein
MYQCTASLHLYCSNQSRHESVEAAQGICRLGASGGGRFATRIATDGGMGSVFFSFNEWVAILGHLFSWSLRRRSSKPGWGEVS